MNKEEIGNMNTTIISTEIEAVIKNLTINKSPGPDGLTSQFYQTFREKLTLILLKFFKKKKKTVEEGTLPASFYEASIILISKPNKENKKKEKKITGQY